jgi:hypothetical protein
MSHTKTLKITPTCFDHQMIIIWWSKYVGVILSVLVCDIWIIVLYIVHESFISTFYTQLCYSKARVLPTQWFDIVLYELWKSYGNHIMSFIFTSLHLILIIVIMLTCWWSLRSQHVAIFPNKNGWVSLKFNGLILSWKKCLSSNHSGCLKQFWNRNVWFVYGSHVILVFI